MYDGGNQNRCFTYIDDAIDGLILAGSHNNAIGEAFNIGNQVPTKISDVIMISLELINSKIKVNKVDTQKKYGSTYQDISYRIPDSSKAEQLLNWKAKIQIREGISKILDWINLNPWYLDKN